MKFIGYESFDHEQPARVGVLITNLGTPTAPEKKALRTFLRQFLSDPRVVEIPRLAWWPILHGIILTLRPARSAAAYHEVWTERGSPLMFHTQDQTEALRSSLEARHGKQLIVDFAMRYGEPSIGQAVQSMLDRGVRKLLVLPLYPQYSGSTTGSTFDALTADLGRRRWLPELRFVNHYCDHPGLIEALANSIRDYREKHGTADRLLFSYHGTPKRCLELGDPYYCQCQKTSRLVAEALGLGESDYAVTFQSRFGKAEWLKPYTDETLKAMPAEGVRSVQVVCPGFSSDCLETLEEIAVENRDYFLTAGGESYSYIPCLNSEPAHIAALTDLVEKQLVGWLQQPPSGS